MDGEVLTEVPQNLQMLVRLVVRGFYTVEDMLIVDMLVRNLCMSEDDLCDLLKFDKKMLRQRINTLKADKLLQARMKMVTLDDGRTQREQYYFINYKSFVNVVKYKLDHIRKKLEMEERDQTSRASFICMNCQRAYTDLEADQLLDMHTGQLLCIICKYEVQEDMSAMPKHDTRQLLSQFNDQMEPLFTLLREVEGSIDININEVDGNEESVQTKEKPIWLSEASSFITTNITSADNSMSESDGIMQNSLKEDKSNTGKNTSDDVLRLLEAHEKKGKRNRDSDSESDNSCDEIKKVKVVERKPIIPYSGTNEIEEIILSDDDDDDHTPYISVGRDKYLITEVNNEIIAQMTQEEKNLYINAYQEYMAGMED